MKLNLPNWVEIIRAENTVFADRRVGFHPGERWNAYLNSAQLVLGFIQDLDLDELPDLFDLKVAAPVLAAARILDSAVSVPWGDGAIPGENSGDLDSVVAYAALAAMAYALLGNFPAASTILQRHAPYLRLREPFLAGVLACAAPALVGALYPPARKPEQLCDFLDALEFYLSAPTEESEQHLVKQHSALQGLASSPFEESLWLSSNVVLRQVCTLVTGKSLVAAVGQVEGYARNLFASGIKTLLPTQYLAIAKSTLYGNKGNALISLPTSTGKSLLSELAIIGSVKDGGVGIFVVPYVALGRQIASRIASRLPPGWLLLRMFGGYAEPAAFTSGDKRHFIVATPERLDVLLRANPGLIDRVQAVVFDEAHMIDSGERGMRVESLVTRLLMKQSSGTDVRIILVSAVIPNLEQLARWTKVSAGNVVTSKWSPSSRRIAIWSADGRLTWYHSDDPITPDGIAKTAPIASVSLPWPHYFAQRSDSFAEIKMHEQSDAANVSFLLSYLWSKYLEPILCVCPTKDMTRRVAASVKLRFTRVDAPGVNVLKAIQLIVTKYQHFLHLKNALERGVAFHNASLPHDLRAAIEDAAAMRELRVVVSTTTLAEGIDLPFRATVLADWLGFKNEKQEPLSPLLIRNIAGRCGRVGSFTEGDVVVYDSPLGDRSYKAGGSKAAYLRTALFSEGDQGIDSSLNEEFTSPSIRGALSSQFLAAVSEQPDVDDLPNRFYSHMFGAQSDSSGRIERLLREIAEELTTSDWQLATRNSPLRTTGLGEAVNLSGFSPTSSRRIAEAMRLVDANAKLSHAVGALLLQLGNLPEQGNVKFRKLIEHYKVGMHDPNQKQKGKPRLLLNTTDLPQVAEWWLAGIDAIEIFSSLPAVKRSARKPPFEQWKAGLEEPSSWDEQFDKFCDFLNSCLGEFVPWLLRACDLLAPHLSPPAPCSAWSDFVEDYRHCRPDRGSSSEPV